MGSLESFVKKFLLKTQAEKLHLKFFLKAYFKRTLGLNQTLEWAPGHISRKIEILRIRYEVQLSILYTGSPFRPQIPTFALHKGSLADFIRYTRYVHQQCGAKKIECM